MKNYEKLKKYQEMKECAT